MNDSDEVRQRIRYLIEHGGVYPEDRQRWPPWVWLLLAVGLAGVLADLLL